MENIKSESLNLSLTLPLKENLTVVPRLIIAGLLSNEKVNIEEIENTKLITSEAINLLIDKFYPNTAIINFYLEKREKKIIFKLKITTEITKNILNNISRNGLTIEILNYLCSKFTLKEVPPKKDFKNFPPKNFIELTLEKEIELEN